MKRLLFTGSAVDLVTPFSAEGELDFEALSALLRFQLEGGSDAVVVGGACGENAALSLAERQALVEHAVTTLNRAVPLISGLEPSGAASAAKEARILSICGADGLLLRPAREGAKPGGFVKTVLAVAEAAGLPIIAETPAGLPLEGYAELAAHPLVLAILGRGLPIGFVAAIASRCGENLALYAGDDSEVLPYLSLGAAGAVSPLANLAPVDLNDICHLYFTGRVRESLALALPFLPLCRLVAGLPALKEALHQTGRGGRACRPPLTPLAGRAKDELLREMLRVGLL